MKITKFTKFDDFDEAEAPAAVAEDFDLEFVTVPFGKYRNQSILDVAKAAPDYIEWMLGAYAKGDFDHPWIGVNKELLRSAITAAAKAKANEAPPIELTEHQRDVVTELMDDIGQGLNIVRLEGGAGYGKSYATAAIAKELGSQGRRVRATAVSYVATQVLQEQLDHIGVSCATLAKTLKFEKVFVEGAEVYRLSADSPEAARVALAEGNVLIVDECSMVSDEIATALFEAVNAHGGLLVLVGDSAQLPPPTQETKSICCEDWGQGVATLTKPMRYAEDSDLYGIEQRSRTNPWGLLSQLPQTESTEVTVVNSMGALVEDYVMRYRAEPDALHRMMLFRRRDVIAANNAIRNRLFGDDALIVEANERLMIMSTSDYPHMPEGSLSDSTRYYSGESFRVSDAELKEYTIKIDGGTYVIPHYEVKFAGRRGTVRIIFGVTENTADEQQTGGPQYSAALGAAAAYGRKTDENGNKLGSWTYFKQLKNDFVLVAYQYATTTHRAQGQTADYAYCDPRSLLSIRGIVGQSLAYVALTRARKHLTIKI